MDIRAILTIVAALTGATCGQTLGPLIRVNQNQQVGFHYAETAIAVNPFNANDLVAMAIELRPSDSGEVHFAVTTDGGATFGPRSLLSQFGLPNCGTTNATVDPIAVASRSTGHIWFGAQKGNHFDAGLVVYTKSPGSSSIVGALVDCATLTGFSKFDRSSLAVGPRVDGGFGEALYDLYNADNFSNCQTLQLLFGKRSVSPIPSAPPGQNWPSGPVGPSGPFALTYTGSTCGENGTGIRAVVIQSGQNAGRIVATYGDRDGPSQLYDPPLAAFSVDGGQSWSRSSGPDPLALPTNRLALANDGTIFPIVRSEIPPGNLILTNYPSIAADPANPNTVYVVFAGKPNPAVPNTDIYIARSLNAGSSFLQSQILHITDAMLGDPVNSFQFNPAITVDQYGGVNIMYTRIIAGATDSTMMINRYARLKPFAVPMTQPIVVRSLTDTPFATSIAPDNAGVGRFIGDYQTIDSSGCVVWACFSSGHETVPGSNPPTNTLNYYIRRITLPECSVADVDGNGEVQPSDMIAFGTSYLANQPTADINTDGAVNPADFVYFTNAYACGCTP